MTDHSELKRLAQAASPGKWDYEQDCLFFYVDGYTKHLMELCEGSDVDGIQQVENAKFIAAANPAAVLALIKELESNKRMLLAAACDIGAIGKALKADMNADGDELLGMAIDLKAQNTRMLEWLKDISRTSGDKGAVMGARELLKEFAQ